jgi:uncharacterized protein (TIGR02598 family)
MKTSLMTVVGSSLIEVSVALGVAGFVLIALFGLLPLGLNNNRAAIRQTNAANLLTDIVADMRSTAVSATQSPRYGVSFSTSSTYYLNEVGGPFPAAAAISGTSFYRLTLTVVPPVAGQRSATGMGVVVSWPAQAQPMNSVGSVSTFVALDRN